QELSSLVGRYGKHLSGSDVSEMAGAENGHGTLDSLDFDAETRELLGLDDIAEILGEIDEEAQVDIDAMEEEAQAIKEGGGLDPDEAVGGVESVPDGESETETE
ncbi:MAG: phosphoesterase, partial [Haloarculaceae archaeon]